MKNIVWLASYPKSGNTWFRMFLANYLKNATEPVTLDEIESTPIASNEHDFEKLIGLNPFELTPDEVDLYRPDIYRELSKEAEESGKVNYKKVHDAYTQNKDGEPLFPEDISKCAVYFVRNPMDVCVSYANHSATEIKKTFEKLFDEKSSMAGKKRGQLRQILMSWKSHVKSWKDQVLIPVHITRYEDMLQKPVETFSSIIRFLELDYDQERLERAIRNSDFKLLQQMEQESGFKEKMQKCENFFWKGKTGNYRDYLSNEQINRIVEYNYDVMKEFGYIDENGQLTV
ncbi:MAG: sulfotransferase domain-containing protein [Bacteroidales bacterium]|nr:sulfotransferase domain-containing protein [Bacteroidales bacterium]